MTNFSVLSIFLFFSQIRFICAKNAKKFVQFYDSKSTQICAPLCPQSPSPWETKKLTKNAKMSISPIDMGFVGRTKLCLYKINFIVIQYT